MIFLPLSVRYIWERRIKTFLGLTVAIPGEEQTKEPPQGKIEVSF